MWNWFTKAMRYKWTPIILDFLMWGLFFSAILQSVWGLVMGLGIALLSYFVKKTLDGVKVEK